MTLESSLEIRKLREKQQSIKEKNLMSLMHQVFLIQCNLANPYHIEFRFYETTFSQYIDPVQK